MSWWDLQRMTTTTTSTSFQQQQQQQQQQNQEVTEEISILLELLQGSQIFANERNGWDSETPGMSMRRKQMYLSCIIDCNCYYPDCPAPYLSNVLYIFVFTSFITSKFANGME
jgi:hypothetical protein